MPVDTPEEVAEVVAQEHVNWFLDIIKPLLETHMVHGFKHGQEYEHSQIPVAKKSHH